VFSPQARGDFVTSFAAAETRPLPDGVQHVMFVLLPLEQMRCSSVVEPDSAPFWMSATAIMLFVLAILAFFLIAHKIGTIEFYLDEVRNNVAMIRRSRADNRRD
jgi:hypothetical protein